VPTVSPPRGFRYSLRARWEAAIAFRDVESATSESFAASSGSLVFAPLRRRHRQASPSRRPDRGGAQGGKLSLYSALRAQVAERVARTFEAKYPGIAVRVERSRRERDSLQRIAQATGAKPGDDQGAA